MSLESVLTIGIYGFTEQAFFDALQHAETDLFCDIRARRGLRGSEYAFANSQRLQARLAELGIPYRHFPELAPTPEIRAAQQSADSKDHISKRQRAELAPAFADRYRQLLASPSAAAALDSIGCSGARRPVLFCVERAPAACHRSLTAEALAKRHADVQHITP